MLKEKAEAISIIISKLINFMDTRMAVTVQTHRKEKCKVCLGLWQNSGQSLPQACKENGEDQNIALLSLSLKSFPLEGKRLNMDKKAHFPHSKWKRMEEGVGICTCHPGIQKVEAGGSLGLQCLHCRVRARLTKIKT